MQDIKSDCELYYLDLNPPKFFDSKGKMHMGRAVRKSGFKHCFSEADLYTTRFGEISYTEIEKYFFGLIDKDGQKAVDYFNNFSYPWDGTHLSNEMVLYMSIQKLRTPKGLGWLGDRLGAKEKNTVLQLMLKMQEIYCAVWTECIWLIADASESDTKFIISDHPVTVFNRRCGPRSQWCRGYNDPDIRYHASHTIFPLSLNKILILTNLSWVRNPYQSETYIRPNPDFFRGTIFKVMDIQTLRKLDEREVQEINFIIKSRALRYIAAAREDWLYPEKHITKSDWYKYGHGYLLMPDPRSVVYGGQMVIGHSDGTASAIDEYGRRPWQKGFKGFDRPGVEEDWYTFLRFQGEFARLFGPYRRGRAFNAMRLDNERDDDEFHQYHLNLEVEHKRRKK
ncbi:MAG: DUF4238 domain-containing protein [bacterium]|nr:DUF4238 domain-containing protein [bacterium]